MSKYYYLPKSLQQAEDAWRKAQASLDFTHSGARQRFLDAVNAHCGVTAPAPAPFAGPFRQLNPSEDVTVHRVQEWWRKVVPGGYARFNSPEAAA